MEKRYLLSTGFRKIISSEEDRAELEQPEPAPEAETCPANIGEVIELLSVWASYGTFKPHWPTINLANEYLQVLSRHPEVSPEALKMLLNWPKKLEVVLENASTISNGDDCSSYFEDELGELLSEIKQATEGKAKGVGDE